MGKVWAIQPDGTYVWYSVSSSPLDAQPDSAGDIWWTDGATVFGRINVDEGTQTTWDFGLDHNLWGLAINANDRLWMTDTDLSHYFGADPVVGVEKLTNGHDVIAPPGPEIAAGEAVTWTYRVGNGGNVPLSDLVVSDDNGTPSLPADDLEVCRFDMLDVDASQTCTLVGVAVLEQYGNTGTVVAYFQDWRLFDEDRSYYFGVEPMHYVYFPLIVR